MFRTVNLNDKFNFVQKLSLPLVVKQMIDLECFLNLCLLAIFPNTKRGTSNTACDEDGGSEACLAGYCIWCVDCVLVRTHLTDGVPSHLQEPPFCGVSCQTCD